MVRSADAVSCRGTSADCDNQHDHHDVRESMDILRAQLQHRPCLLAGHGRSLIGVSGIPHIAVSSLISCWLRSLCQGALRR